MANIANVRRFNGTSDYVEVGIGGLAADVTATTFAAIVRSNADVAAYRTVLSIADPAGHAFGVSTFEAIYYYEGSNVPESDSDLVQAADAWVLMAVTKPNGNGVTPRFHRYIYSSLTWEHQDGGTTCDDPATPTGASNVYLGASDPTLEWFGADMACIGYWRTTALSDGQLEGIVGSIASWEALSPSSLWLLNQTSVATTIEDRTGTSDEIGRSGTSVQVPSGLTFDVGGASDTPALAWLTA